MYKHYTPLMAGFMSLAAGLAAGFVPSLTAAAVTTAEDRMGGTLRAQIAGRTVHLPSLKSDIKAHIQGDLATVTVRQTFVNSSQTPMNATYLFPLNKDAAVFHMQMDVGDERILAVIKKKEEARKTFEQAKRQGKAAALLTQHRPNMFTQELANLMPGQPVHITLKYAQVVPRIDGAYELVVPLVVGPRYTPQPVSSMQTVVMPGRAEDEEAGSRQKAAPQSGTWHFSAPPAYPSVSGLDIPDTIAKDRVSIEVDLKAGFSIKDVTSQTHAIVTSGGIRQKVARLQEGRTIDNKDFVLRYQLAGRSLEAGLMTHRDQRGDFFSLLLEPPKVPHQADIMPREMVFVLDTSGSMSGLPIEASKTFMRQALKSLRSTDYFRIIRFSNNATEFTSGPVQATLLNKVAGRRYVDSLHAGGGTEIRKSIEQAFAVRQQPGTLRIVTFLTDGYIGNESEIFRLISQHQNDARIYAFGVGTSVNRYLLTQMARMGRGFARFIDPTEDGHVAATRLAKRLEAPLLTDIEVDWGTLGAQNVTPSIIPDLFKGDSLRFMAKAGSKLVPGSTHIVTIKGMVNGRKASLPLKVQVTDNGDVESTQALPLVWARTQIADHMREMMTPLSQRRSGQTDRSLREMVTRLGLHYSLMTQWTSFVAVSQRIVNQNPASNVDGAVPLNQVKGVSEYAYPHKGNRQHAQNRSPLQHGIIQQRHAMFQMPAGGQQHFQTFSGGSTPEPGTMGGLLVLVLMMLASLLWKRRKWV